MNITSGSGLKEAPETKTIIIKSTHSTPRSEAPGMLRVDTGGPFYPDLKIGVWRRRTYQLPFPPSPHPSPQWGEEKGEGMIFIGTSGYNYPHWWNGTFYPSDLPQKKWLEFYAEYFNTVELNVSFYRLPKKEIFQGWYKRTPKKFVFAVKGSRFITHIKRLKECREPLSLFFDHTSPLKEKLGAVLWQLPPRFKFQKERLEEFCVLLSTLPRSRLHRHAFEFRDESWLCNEAFRILEEFGFAFCIAHGSGLPFIEKVTSNFIYLRLHGGEVLYASSYSDKELKQWAENLQDWRKKDKTAFVYFNNDAYGFAVKDALTLKKWMSQDRVIP